jgi:hypothetical protein
VQTKPSILDVIEAVRAHISADFPGVAAVEVQIELSNGRRYTLPIGGAKANDGHADDFSTATWLGKHYEFNFAQSQAVHLLWEAYEADSPSVNGAVLIENIETGSDRVSGVFKHHPAWGTMIVPGERRNTWRLRGK